MGLRSIASARLRLLCAGIVLSSAVLVIGSIPAEQAQSASILPDTIMFDSNRTGNYELFTFNRTTQQTTQLTSNPFYDTAAPKLSPDRTKILFLRAQKGDHGRPVVGDFREHHSVWL